MIEWYNALDGLSKLFLLFALFGGFFFTARLVISFFIGEFSAHAGDVAGGHSATGAPGDTDLSFQFLTVQGITAFFLFSGLAGLVMRQQLESGSAISALIAALAGGTALFGNAALVRAMLGLQSNGTLDMSNAAGHEATVYLTIKSGGAGQVRMEIQQRLQVFDAVSDCGRDIPTGARVWVTGFNGAALMVEPLE